MESIIYHDFQTIEEFENCEYVLCPSEEAAKFIVKHCQSTMLHKKFEFKGEAWQNFKLYISKKVTHALVYFPDLKFCFLYEFNWWEKNGYIIGSDFTCEIQEVNDLMPKHWKSWDDVKTFVDLKDIVVTPESFLLRSQIFGKKYFTDIRK